MGAAYSERLTATDAAFLHLEEPNVPMHVAAVGILQGEIRRVKAGAFPVDALCELIESSLHKSPRLRERLAYVPFLRHPVWVDDDRFDISYHVRHVALPAPGDLYQLKRLIGQLLSQPIDRGKPMWEIWVIDGLDDGSSALVFKAHHCVVDALSGISLFATLFEAEASGRATVEERLWRPRPQPGRLRLLTGELGHRFSIVLRALRALPGALLHFRDTCRLFSETVLGIAETVRGGLTPTTKTSLNRPIGPGRRFDWIRTDISEIKVIRERFGGTLNDVVLSTVAGAVGRFLRGRGERVDGDTLFRVEVPVSTRKPDDADRPGNRAVNFLAPIPIDESDPQLRLQRTIETTTKLKATRLASGAETIEKICDRTVPSVLARLIRLSVSTRSLNLVVANVPGPPVAVPLLGGCASALYPAVPLLMNHTLGIALFSYDGTLCWGFHADRQAVPDLAEFVGLVEEEFGRLLTAASADGEQAGRLAGGGGA